MRMPAIVLIVLLAVVAVALHFLFFGPYSAKYEEYSQDLDQKRDAFMALTKNAEDPAQIAALTRQLMSENETNQKRLYDISQTYQLVKPQPGDGDLEEAILEVLRSLEAAETSPASLQPTAPENAATRVTVLQNWGLASDLREGEGDNRYFHATDENMRVYAASPNRISTASGTIELMMRPIAWDEDEEGSRASRSERVIFRAESPRPKGRGLGSSASSIQLSVVPYESLDFSITGPNGSRFSRSAGIRDWNPGEWHRVTMTWGEMQSQSDLYVDGRKPAVATTSRRTGRPAGAPPMGIFPDRFLNRNPYMGRAPVPSTRPSAPPPSLDKTPVPENLEKIFLGRTENAPESAGVDIDNLITLRRTATSDEITSGIRYNDDVLMFDTFQTAYGDTRLLVSALQGMEGCLKLIKDPVTKADLKEQKQEEYDLLRESIGLPDEELATRSPFTRYLVTALIADQIHRIVGERYTLDEIKRILKVPRATRGVEAERKALGTMLGFAQLALDIENQAVKDEITELRHVKILGESSTTSDADLLAEFENLVDKLKKDLGIQEFEYPGMGGGPGMPPMLGFQRSFGFPGMMGGPMGGQNLPEAYKPEDTSDFQAVQAAQAKYHLDYTKYNRWKKDLQRGIIPPDARSEIAKGAGDSLYTRRILNVEILGKIDYLPKFLYDLEYEKRLASLDWVSLDREAEDLIRCGVGVNIHYIASEPIANPEEGQGGGTM